MIFHSNEAREGMKREYLDDPGYNFEAVNRASKACGPLVKWAIAQVSNPVLCTCVVVNGLAIE